MHVLNYNKLNNRVLAEIVDENYVFRTMDRVMQQSTMHDFCRAIEIFFAELFQCERVNVVLVHRFKRYLYRVELEKSGTFKLCRFELQAGIAGYVCVSSHPVITESVQSEAKFSAEIDDPRAPPNSLARQMVSCPVNAADDFAQMNKEGQTSLPRAVIQLINKKEAMPVTSNPPSEDVAHLLRAGFRFTQDDVEKIERMSMILGRCHEMVNKIE